MQLKLSKKQWMEIGKQAGWIFTNAQSIQNNQQFQDEGHASDELPQQEQIDNPIEQTNPDDLIHKRRYVKVTMSDGDVIETWINGTKDEITKYYLENNFTKQDETTFHHGIKIDFLGDEPIH